MRQTGDQFHQDSSNQTAKGIFACSGEFWTLGLNGPSFLLRDLKGLGYIQRLLQHPGQDLHVLDLLREVPSVEGSEKAALLAGATVTIGRLGAAGELLDPRAKEDYRRRLRELGEELDEHRASGNAARAAEIESEIDAIVRELSRAVGLGGRDRRAGSWAERARLNVTRAIRTAIQKIFEHHAAIGGVLERGIRTGIFCRYTLDATTPIDWRFSVEDPETASPELAPGSPDLQARAHLLSDRDQRSTFVGRDAERAALRDVLEQVRASSGRFVIIAGAPGVGKTRMAAEFAREATQCGTLTLVGSCYDRDDAVPFVAFVEMLESALAQAPTLQAFRNALGSEAPEIARLMPQLRRIFPDIPPAMELPPEQTRRILFEAIVQVLSRAAARRPILLLVDDLHWADEGTLSLLNHLVRSAARMPIMIVGIYRNNELELSGLLAKTLDEFTRLHVMSRVDLTGLPQDAVRAMIHALSGREPPPDLVRFIFSATAGNPFFVEELFRHLMERGKLLDTNGEFLHDLALGDTEVPQSLRLVIGRRLACLSKGTQGMLGTAAVIGPTFAFELLEAAIRIEADKLLDHVEEAERAGLIAGVMQHSVAHFQFAHDLVRQVILADLSAARVQRTHLAVASAIEQIYQGEIEDYALDLAHHLWQAGANADENKTLRFLAMAGRRSIEQSAHKSALTYLNNALELVRKLPDSQQHAQSEVDILIDYGVATAAMEGWYVSEYGVAYKRARELCYRLGRDEQRLFKVLLGLTSFHRQIPELKVALSYGEEIMELARAAENDEMLVQANWVCGSARFFMGDLTGAHFNFESSLRSYDPKNRTLRFQAQDPGIQAGIYDAMTLWILGYPERAAERAHQAIEVARAFGSPLDLVSCLCITAKYDSIRHDFWRAARAIQEGLELANEHEFGFFKEGLIAYQTIGLAAMGKLDELKAVSRRHRKLSEAGYELAQTWARSYLAEGLGNAGRLDTALSLVAQAAALVDRNEERYVEPEIHRIRGELTLKQIPGNSRSALEVKSLECSAEASFRSAIGIAQLQHAKSFELRASLSLSRLLMRSERTVEARELLSGIYSHFTEGFEMPELREARSLIDQSTS